MAPLAEDVEVGKINGTLELKEGEIKGALEFGEETLQLDSQTKLKDVCSVVSDAQSEMKRLERKWKSSEKVLQEVEEALQTAQNAVALMSELWRQQEQLVHERDAALRFANEQEAWMQNAVKIAEKSLEDLRGQQKQLVRERDAALRFANGQEARIAKEREAKQKAEKFLTSAQREKRMLERELMSAGIEAAEEEFQTDQAHQKELDDLRTAMDDLRKELVEYAWKEKRILERALVSARMEAAEEEFQTDQAHQKELNDLRTAMNGMRKELVDARKELVEVRKERGRSRLKRGRS